MDDEKLIAAVRTHPELYDMSHGKYMDTNLKLRVWAGIGKELNEDEGLCRSRWNNIRDNYRKSLRKMGRRTTLSGRRLKYYKYTKLLTFLNPFFEKMGPDNSVMAPPEDSRSTDDMNETCFSEVMQSQVPENLQDARNEQDTQSELKISCVGSKESRESTSSQTLNNSKVMQKAKTNDAVDAFLNLIGATLKTLNPCQQNMAKSEIFNVVQKYELQMIVEENHSGQNSTQSSTNISTNMETDPLEDTRSPFLQSFCKSL